MCIRDRSPNDNQQAEVPDARANIKVAEVAVGATQIAPAAAGHPNCTANDHHHQAAAVQRASCATLYIETVPSVDDWEFWSADKVVRICIPLVHS